MSVLLRCACQDCCARRTHYDRVEVANAEAHRRWVTARARSQALRCPTCDRWYVEALS